MRNPEDLARAVLDAESAKEDLEQERARILAGLLEKMDGGQDTAEVKARLTGKDQELQATTLRISEAQTALERAIAAELDTQIKNLPESQQMRTKEFADAELELARQAAVCVHLLKGYFGSEGPIKIEFREGHFGPGYMSAEQKSQLDRMKPVFKAALDELKETDPQPATYLARGGALARLRETEKDPLFRAAWLNKAKIMIMRLAKEKKDD